MRKTLALAAVLATVSLAASGLTACSGASNTGHTTVADGVRFEYGLAPTAKPHTFRVNLTLADAKSGAAINDANVAISVYGPGYDGGDLVNLKRGETGGYGGEVVMPKAASYNLTFQVNRTTAPSAMAVFAALPPAAVASADPAAPPH